MPPPEASHGLGRSRALSGCGTCKAATLGGSACTCPAASSFPLPFAMVSNYCTTAQRGGTCTDSGCSLRHDILRCESCDCSFPPASLQEHQRGSRHLQNVASNGAQPSPPSPTIEFAAPANISPPGGDTPRDTDPRVNVSGEGGLDFFVEGSGTSANPLFSSINHTISIEKTDLSSCLSFQTITLRPSLDSWCE